MPPKNNTQGPAAAAAAPLPAAAAVAPLAAAAAPLAATAPNPAQRDDITFRQHQLYAQCCLNNRDDGENQANRKLSRLIANEKFSRALIPNYDHLNYDPLFEFECFRGRVEHLCDKITNPGNDNVTHQLTLELETLYEAMGILCNIDLDEEDWDYFMTCCIPGLTDFVHNEPIRQRSHDDESSSEEEAEDADESRVEEEITFGTREEQKQHITFTEIICKLNKAKFTLNKASLTLFWRLTQQYAKNNVDDAVALLVDMFTNEVSVISQLSPEQREFCRNYALNKIKKLFLAEWIVADEESETISNVFKNAIRSVATLAQTIITARLNPRETAQSFGMEDAPDDPSWVLNLPLYTRDALSTKISNDFNCQLLHISPAEAARLQQADLGNAISQLVTALIQNNISISCTFPAELFFAAKENADCDCDGASILEHFTQITNAIRLLNQHGLLNQENLTLVLNYIDFTNQLISVGDRFTRASLVETIREYNNKYQQLTHLAHHAQIAAQQQPPRTGGEEPPPRPSISAAATAHRAEKGMRPLEEEEEEEEHELAHRPKRRAEQNEEEEEENNSETYWARPASPSLFSPPWAPPPTSPDNNETLNRSPSPSNE